jgi:preprotein translocase subunit SecE
MTVEEDAKRERAAGEGENAPEESEIPSDASAPDEERDAPSDALAVRGSTGMSPVASDLNDDSGEDHDVSPVAPTQLGARRFVFAGYFAAGIGIAFISSKALDFAWLKLQGYKPAVGDPRDEIVMPLSALIGAGVAVYYWFRTRARQLAEEVAAEMSKVTWPSRTEVTNGTVVVIVTTLVSTVFFALMDKFWGFITNLVYGGT